jgi:hypothetical protein
MCVSRHSWRKTLSGRYMKNNHEEVARHPRPYQAKGMTLKDLTSGRIRDWMGWAVVYYAVHREERSRDPFAKVGEAWEVSKDKGILTPAKLGRLIAVPTPDLRLYAALLLTTLYGLRRGERSWG